MRPVESRIAPPSWTWIFRIADTTYSQSAFRDCPKRGTNNALSANLDVLGGKYGSKSAVLVLCKATGQAPLTLFGQSLHALRWISLWTMRQTPPGGIMYVVANPLEKNAGWPGEKEAAVSSEVEENKAIVRRFLEATARGDLAAMDEMIAPDFVDRSLMSGQEPDREGFKRSVAEMDAPFTNQRVTIEDQIAAGDKVLTRVTYRATHDQGELLGIAPTGEEWTEASIDPWLQRLEEENRERERVEQEMRVARTIQQANLPQRDAHARGLAVGIDLPA